VGAKNKKFKTKETRGERLFLGFYRFFCCCEGEKYFSVRKIQNRSLEPPGGKTGNCPFVLDKRAQI
jgi:hypothetical protein